MKFLKDISWNSAAYIIPMLLALPILGILARHLGVERFGLFMLIFTIFGYASIFDLGFSRALVRCISISRENDKDVKEYLFSSSFLISFLAVLPLSVLIMFSEEIVTLLNVSKANLDDARSSILLVAIGFPLLMLTTLWYGYLEGKERFKELSIIKLINSTALSVLPLICVLYEQSLEYAVIGLLAARAISLIIIVSYIFSEVNNVKSRYFNLGKVRELLSYGGWLTLTNLISPLLSTIDRFLLSSMSGASKVAFYTAPSELINRLLILPGIITRTAFPRLARSNDFELKKKIRIGIGILMTLFTFTILILSELIITVWLGSEYSESVYTLRILAIGLFFAGLSRLPYMAVQAAGHSKVAAYIHLAELIPYMLLLYFLVKEYSFNGAAIAWTIRVFVDFLLFTLCENYFCSNKKYSEITVER